MSSKGLPGSIDYFFFYKRKFISCIYPVVVINPDREFITDSSIYGYFTTATTNWLTAQQSCINWGGNLATIPSSKVDSLLYYMPESSDQFDCWIGLNDRDTEAFNNGSAFVWIDGSNSTYRNFATAPDTEPNNIGGSQDCVAFRFDLGQSNGWHDGNCNDQATCYFCDKPSKCKNSYIYTIKTQLKYMCIYVMGDVVNREMLSNRQHLPREMLVIYHLWLQLFIIMVSIIIIYIIS